MASVKSTVLLLLLTTATGASAACTTPRQRRAWHTLSNSAKLEYINAELCIMKKPATLGLPGARTQFDELQAIHQVQAYAVHDVKDAGKFTSSDVFDPVYGFGGDGSGRNRCITTGPFANYTNALGPAYQVTDHCINRRISNGVSASSGQAQVDNCLKKSTWDEAWPCIEQDPHRGGHGGVGGQMVDGVASPGDPLFYLHHTWLDKIYWDWQARDRKTRTSTISGANVAPKRGFGIPRPSNIPRPTGAAGDPGLVTTVNHVLNMYGNGPNRTVAEVLDIQGDYLCYTYVEP